MGRVLCFVDSDCSFYSFQGDGILLGLVFQTDLGREIKKKNPTTVKMKNGTKRN